jgi:hypothetical protein
VLQLDAASARRSFHPEAPPNAADEALALVQELVHTHGEVRERRLVGTSSGLGLRTFYQVRFGHTWVTLAIEWQGEKVRAVRRSEEQWPFRVVLQRLDDGRLVGKSIDGRVDLAITIVGKRLELHGRPDSKPFVATRVPATPPR